MPFRWVRPEQAGPAALGLLVPPGTRTFVILRPRALNWDLILLQGVVGVRFRDLSQTEAQTVAQSLSQALDRWGRGGRGHISPVPTELGGFHVWVDVDEFSFVLCARNPGQPYRPQWFATTEQAQQAILGVQSILPPPSDREQELYVNTRNFTMPS